eukprot:13173619-Alexandrium_andersonii.AAC.1
MLEGLGLPPCWITLLQKFYQGNKQFIGRRQKECFDTQVGIRHGCPLSPLLCAVATDLLLRRVQIALGNDGI